MFVFFAPARLELFLSPDIGKPPLILQPKSSITLHAVTRDFRPHPKSPIYNSNMKYARNGGRP